MKDLFGKLLGKKTPPEAGKPVSPSSQPGKAAKRTPTPKAPRPHKPQIEIINDPDHALLAREELLIKDSIGVLINENRRRDYAILLINRAEKEVRIVCSEETYEEFGARDTFYLTTRKRLLERNYKLSKVSRVYASRDIIESIYNQAQKEKTDEERRREAGQLEIRFRRLLREALELGSSDIHIEVRRDNAQIRLRRKGLLLPHRKLDVDRAQQMAKVIYQVLADEKAVSFNPREPQDANIHIFFEDSNTEIRVRLATLPAYPDGFDMVMRLIPMGQDMSGLTLHSLGYNEEQIEHLQTALSQPIGLIILAGTTGSGKSTSLNVMIRGRIADSNGEIKVITVEDPPEALIPEATQVPGNRSRAGEASDSSKFADVIRAAMRCDPDVIMIGEIRDRASALLTRDIVQTGHQGMSTIHAASAIGIVPRLRANGLDNDVLGGNDFLQALIYQTLVPTLCDHCKVDYQAYAESAAGKPRAEGILKRLDQVLGAANTSGVYFRNNEGCEHCDRGIKSRTVVAEVVLPTREMRELISQGKDNHAWDRYLKSGGKTILHHGLEKIAHGVCCPFDVEAKLGLLNVRMNAIQSSLEMADKSLDGGLDEIELEQ